MIQNKHGDEMKHALLGRARAGVLDEPLKRQVDIDLILGGYGVTAHFPVTHALQIHTINDLFYRQCIRQVILISQHEQGNVCQLRFLQQIMQFGFGRIKFIRIS